MGGAGGRQGLRDLAEDDRGVAECRKRFQRARQIEGATVGPVLAVLVGGRRAEEAARVLMPIACCSPDDQPAPLARDWQPSLVGPPDAAPSPSPSHPATQPPAPAVTIPTPAGPRFALPAPSRKVLHGGTFLGVPPLYTGRRQCPFQKRRVLPESDPLGCPAGHRLVRGPPAVKGPRGGSGGRTEGQRVAFIGGALLASNRAHGAGGSVAHALPSGTRVVFWFFCQDLLWWLVVNRRRFDG